MIWLVSAYKTATHCPQHSLNLEAYLTSGSYCLLEMQTISVLRFKLLLRWARDVLLNQFSLIGRAKPPSK